MAATTTTISVGSPGKGVHFHESDLSDTPVLVFSDGRYVKSILVEGGAAAEIVIFRDVANTPVWFRVPVDTAANSGRAFLDFGDRGIYLSSLEIVCASASAGGVTVSIRYL